MPKEQSQRLLKVLLSLGLAGGAMGALAVASRAQPTRIPAGDPQQVPTARYGRGEPVELSLIVEEWRDRYPAIPVYACSCNAETCGDIELWPFREFTRYQPFVALGEFNAANNEDYGFNCFEMETGERP